MAVIFVKRMKVFYFVMCFEVRLPGLPPPACSPGPHVTPWGHQPPPKRHHSRAGLHVPTALPCLAIRPTKPSPPAWPQPGPLLREMPDAQGWGCPDAPGCSWLWLGWVWAARPYHAALPWGVLTAPAPGSCRPVRDMALRPLFSFLRYVSVCSWVLCLYSLIIFSNGLNLVGFMFNDQSYLEWNLTDKIFNFCLLALD